MMFTDSHFPASPQPMNINQENPMKFDPNVLDLHGLHGKLWDELDEWHEILGASCKIGTGHHGFLPCFLFFFPVKLFP